MPPTTFHHPASPPPPFLCPALIPTLPSPSLQGLAHASLCLMPSSFFCFSWIIIICYFPSGLSNIPPLPETFPDLFSFYGCPLALCTHLIEILHLFGTFPFPSLSPAGDSFFPVCPFRVRTMFFPLCIQASSPALGTEQILSNCFWSEWTEEQGGAKRSAARHWRVQWGGRGNPPTQVC